MIKQETTSRPDNPHGFELFVVITTFISGGLLILYFVGSPIPKAIVLLSLYVSLSIEYAGVVMIMVRRFRQFRKEKYEREEKENVGKK
jgi:hypothetical protein